VPVAADSRLRILLGDLIAVMLGKPTAYAASVQLAGAATFCIPDLHVSGRCL
jgi:hypothetical protein